MKECTEQDIKIKDKCPYCIGEFCAFSIGMVKQLTKCRHYGENIYDNKTNN